MTGLLTRYVRADYHTLLLDCSSLSTPPPLPPPSNTCHMESSTSPTYIADLLQIYINSFEISIFLYSFSTGEKWKRRRRQITPTFHFKILNEFIQVFEEQSKILVSVLKVREIPLMNERSRVFSCFIKAILGKRIMRGVAVARSPPEPTSRFSGSIS